MSVPEKIYPRHVSAEEALDDKISGVTDGKAPA